MSIFQFFALTFSLSIFSLQGAELKCEVEIKELNLCAQLSWSEGPEWGKFSHAELKYWKKQDKGQTLVDPQEELVAYPWMIMPRMEHGGRAPVVTKVSDGHYRLERFQFAKMPGHWEVRLKKKGGSERNDALAIFRVPLEQ